MTNDSYLDIIDGFESVNSIDINQTITLENGFTAEVSPNVPNDYAIGCQLEMNASDNSWEADFTLTAFAPVLTVHSVIIENDDNGNGLLDAGESADLQLMLENSGGSDLDPFALNLESNNPFITVINGLDHSDFIEENDVYTFHYTIQTDENTPLGYHAECILVGTSEIGFQYNSTFVISIGQVLEDFETGNFYLYPWEFEGESEWEISTDAQEGMFSAKSGGILDNQTSELTVTLDVIEPGDISFFRKVSSSPNNDFLIFKIDGSQLGQWSGNIDWSSVSYPVSEGQHTFSWIFQKDGWDSQGEDCAWIDFIIFPTVTETPLPELYVSTHSIHASTIPGEIDTESFLIENIGTELLNYTITHSAFGTRDDFEFEIPDSPDQYNWSTNTLTDADWIEYEISEPNISIDSWTISFDWQTDWWPTEGSFWVTSPYGTTALISEDIDASGNYSVTLDSFAGELLPGIWTLWIEDTYGDGGHQASNITMSIASAAPENNWLSVDTYSGSVLPSETQPINVFCNATELMEGDYIGTINIQSNDPFNSLVGINVYFTVGESVNEISIDIIEGWNLIGSPFNYDDMNYQSVFPNSIENTLFTYEVNGYSPTTDVEMGYGYWLRFEDSETTVLTGNPVENLSISLMEGWNTISGISFPVSIANISDPDGLIIPNTSYGFAETGYVFSETLIPGYGYWIRSIGSGEIQLSLSNRGKITSQFENKLREANRITINGKPLFFGVSIPESEKIYYSLPPKPPIGGFDVRFSSNLIYAENSGIIEIMIDKNLLTINCNIVDGKSWELISITANNTKWNEVILLTNETQITLNSEVERWFLRKSTSPNVPTEFILHPAHPNPFNPVTTIQFSIPNVEKLHATSLRIYDITGKLVETLMDEQLSQGNHSVRWDAEKLSSGVYFVMLETTRQREIQKVVLMK